MVTILQIFAPLLVRILRIIIRKSTPAIRKEICDFVREWEQKAKATPNKVDDVLAELVKAILVMK